MMLSKMRTRRRNNSLVAPKLSMQTRKGPLEANKKSASDRLGGWAEEGGILVSPSAAREKEGGDISRSVHIKKMQRGAQTLREDVGGRGKTETAKPEGMEKGQSTERRDGYGRGNIPAAPAKK